jgi:oxygen-dependent protoporphyrinogen oxidase
MGIEQMSEKLAQTAGSLKGRVPAQEKITRIAVVGAGCTGLRLAHLLTRWQRERPESRRLMLTLYDVHPRTGGLIYTQREPSGLIIEAAAQGVLASRTVFLQTLEELGLTPSDVIVPPSEKQLQTRYIIAPSGRMAPLNGPVSLISSGILSVAALIRAVSEFFKPPAQPPHPDETLYEFAERRFGRSVAENMIIPFTTGIWGGGAEKILARHAFPALVELEARYGGVLRGLFARKIFGGQQQGQLAAKTLLYRWPAGLISFPQGMQKLIEVFEKNLRLWAAESPINHLDFRFASPVTSIQATGEGQLRINEKDEFDAVFWTAAPWQADFLNWHKNEVQREWELLQTPPAHSLIVVNVSGPKDNCSKNGFGVLARRESDGLLGVLFVHSIYPQHVPEGCTSYRILLGGDRRPEMAEWSDQQLTEYALSSLLKLELIDKSNLQIQRTSVIRWPKAVGIADEGHDERQKALWRIQAHCKGIFFAGIYRKGVGVADALQSAQDCFVEWQESSVR